jgi:hypothetical protein
VEVSKAFFHVSGRRLILYSIFSLRKKERYNLNGWYVVHARVGAGDSNHGDGTSAPVKDGVGGTGVYAGSLRATCSARRSQ